jgi:virginiamycin B lyase
MFGGPKIAAVAALALTCAALAATSAVADPGVVSEYPIPVETTPYALATGPEGKIWFVDSGGHPHGGTMVGRMSTSGAIAASEVVAFPNPGLGLALTLGPDGNMWVEQEGHLDKVPPSVSSSGEIAAYEYGSGAHSGGSGSIATGPDGRLWIGLDEQIGAATTGGEVHLFETGSPAAISGVTSGPGERLWFGAGNRIERIATNGAHSGGDEFPLPESASGIDGMTLGPDGNLWFTVTSPSAVGKITPTGTITLFRTPTTSALPFGIAAGPDGHMWFTERNADAIGSIPVTATSGSEIHEYSVAHSNAGVLGIVAGPDNRMWFAESNENQLGAITTGAATPSGGGEKTSTGGSTNGAGSNSGSSSSGGGSGGSGGSGGRPSLPGVPLATGCVSEQLSLVDVLAHGATAQLLGVAPRSAAGQQVKVLSAWNGKVIGKAKVAANGSFTASVSAPPSRLRHSAKGSYEVELGNGKSAPVAYTRRLYTSAITASGRTITFAGSVTPPLAKPAAPVVIRAATSCAGVARGTVVATVTPSRGGTFSATIKLPAALEAAASAYFRAETVVRKAAGKKKTTSATGLVRGIRLTP